MTEKLKIQKIWLAMGLGKGTEEYEEAEKKYRARFKDNPIGFVKVVDNPDWEEMGMLCRWEHCIEITPLRDERDENSCPIFGHDCPGGPRQVRNCRVDLGYMIKDIDPESTKVIEDLVRITTWCERCGKETLHERHKYVEKKFCLECVLITEDIGGITGG